MQTSGSLQCRRPLISLFKRSPVNLDIRWCLSLCLLNSNEDFPVKAICCSGRLGDAEFVCLGSEGRQEIQGI